MSTKRRWSKREADVLRPCLTSCRARGTRRPSPTPGNTHPSSQAGLLTRRHPSPAPSRTNYIVQWPIVGVVGPTAAGAAPECLIHGLNRGTGFPFHLSPRPWGWAPETMGILYLVASRQQGTNDLWVSTSDIANPWNSFTIVCFWVGGVAVLCKGKYLDDALATYLRASRALRLLDWRNGFDPLGVVQSTRE